MMHVWIDQDLCTGDAQCADICPDLFVMHEDDDGYKAYVRAVGPRSRAVVGAPNVRGGAAVADVPETMEGAVVEAATFCPGECIFVEPAS
jgi:ferredoxin